MPAYTVVLITDDDAIDDSCTVKVKTKTDCPNRQEAQRRALRKFNQLMMKPKDDAPSFALRLHDSEWEKGGTMTRSMMREFINELWEEHGGPPPRM